MKAENYRNTANLTTKDNFFPKTISATLRYMLGKKSDGIFGNVLGQLGQLSKQTGSQVIKEPVRVTKTAGNQIVTPLETVELDKNRQVKKAAGTVGLKEQITGGEKDENTIDFVKQLYGPTDKTEKNVQELSEKAQPKINTQTPQSPQESRELLEAQERLQKLRESHKETYYDPLVNRPVQRPEEAQEKEERATDRAERLHEEDLQKKQKEEEKKKPIAVTQAANKTEMFRGAAG